MRGLHGPLVAVSAAMAAVGVVALVGLLVDGRELLNQPIWLKTFKFCVSLPLYLLTLAWLLSLLPRWRRAGWWLGTVVAAALALDLAVIVLQTIIRGRRAHFNVEDATDRLLHNLLATGAYVAMLAVVVVAVLLVFQRLPDKAQATAVRAGLALSVLGMAVAALMFTPPPAQQARIDAGRTPTIVGAHTVGDVDGGPGLPLVGWSTVGGDLRVAHFVGLHAIQLLPLLLLALVAASTRVPALRDELLRRNLLRVASCGYLAMVLILTWQAQRGQSVVDPDATTLLTAGGVVAFVAVGSVAAVRRSRANTLPARERSPVDA
ncbi:hypothetical protein JHE00_19980 [Prauserella sp. ASG 168]|uniref:Uncharacterized protein n=1 Tax=Prauserella cavernicola TaxID=2800127 RepID=A0A934QWJ2_9PSEU|nr:hypothetical protein [Prauserella cavernicola]